MTCRPVCLTQVVKENPPPGFTSLAGATLALGLWLMVDHNYVCMEDYDGKIWVTHRDNPFGMFLPPGGRQIFLAVGDYVEYHSWFRAAFTEVRAIGREPLTASIPYQLAVRNWYAGCADGFNSDLAADTGPQVPLRAVNGYVAFRTWFNDDIKSGDYRLTQGEISSLCSELWAAESAKEIWAKTAKLYTAARDQGTVHHLPDFVRLEFGKHGVELNGANLAESIGRNLETFKRQAKKDKKCKTDVSALRLNGQRSERNGDIAGCESTLPIGDDYDENFFQGDAITTPGRIEKFDRAVAGDVNQTLDEIQNYNQQEL
uniref:Putative mating type 1-1-1 protein n=1 Tax=Phymatotrichopsis omnivora TaxID=231936 RepID=A0A8B0M8C3_9PEZI|nr:putative mating type 1-1-1 protein [Phymatotrichopsis omnivora]